MMPPRFAAATQDMPKKTPSWSHIRVRVRPGRRSQGWLVTGHAAWVVALGRGSVRANKREGDGATPRGRFRPLRVWWRHDRVTRPATRLPVRRLGHEDAWCEDPADRRYNRPFRLGPSGAGDRLWREDHLYDVIVEIDHNVRPRVAGRGSAVFLHVARPGLKPTVGCVAMPHLALRQLLSRLGPHSRIDIR
jgi:L,D-peptidoglycan transpeptidase YkuD (ErfK/YbiS/YcfS/YnhG family)